MIGIFQVFACTPNIAQYPPSRIISSQQVLGDSTTKPELTTVQGARQKTVVVHVRAQV